MSRPVTAARKRSASIAAMASRSSDWSSRGTRSSEGHACSSIGCGRLGFPGARPSPSSLAPSCPLSENEREN